MNLPSHPSRREFLKTSAATAGLATLSPRAYSHILGANDRINFGMIGIGVMGGGHFKEMLPERDRFNTAIVHACDVYRRRAERAAQEAGGQAQATQNYEDVLADKGVDAVLTATPDHWHAKIAIDAIRAGKHVYLEKPMCHTIEQALELFKVEQENRGKIRVQVGVQSTSFELNGKVRDYIQKNGIGKLVMMNSSFCRNNTAGQWRDYGDWENIKDPKAGGIDWDMWLGYRFNCAGQQLAPQREWDPKRFFQFRCYWDYSGGVATDLFFHRLTQLLKATGLEFPERVVSAGGIWVFNRNHPIPESRGGGPDDREVPDMYNTMIDYPGGPTVTLVGSMVNDTNVLPIIAGHDATIEFNDAETPTVATIKPQSATGRVKETVTLKGEPGGQSKHRENFVKACRDPKVELYCPVSLALRTNVAITLGVRSYRERKVYGWDAKEQKAVTV
jgi:predicted dehydrogenase